MLYVRFIYGLLESRSGGGNGLRDTADMLHARFGEKVFIETGEWNDDHWKAVTPFVYTTDNRDKIMLVGHSFGGGAAVTLADQLWDRCAEFKTTPRVDSLILLDPVPTRLGHRIRSSGFDLPLIVREAHCFWRGWHRSWWGYAPYCKPILSPLSPADKFSNEIVWRRNDDGSYIFTADDMTEPEDCTRVGHSGLGYVPAVREFIIEQARRLIEGERTIV